jgi:hypothetical protein
MKTLILLALLVSNLAFAHDTYVHGYMRSNGTYVQGYHRTSPDNTVNNNYGTQGNVNPYTNVYGTRPRNEEQPEGEYNSGNGLGKLPKNNYGGYGGYGNQNSGE